MLGPHTHRDNPVSRIMCAPVASPVTVCKHLKSNNSTFQVDRGVSEGFSAELARDSTW
jgi:hypothetical protein